ncbi:MAG: bifunctional nicotinamide-nucleotide adenylyltransferase/Nudix hydroxylase [Gammaproteobacteria bacterium]|nr:bifunctional nicotinamide-nucleotide adenylyltransferase/Nudix hydroxylase [Gammaproteobacteria bacterium]
MAKVGVFIGRFQPFHRGHLAIIQKALETCDKLIIVVGSINRARTIKNPWTFEERKALILAGLALNPLSPSLPHEGGGGFKGVILGVEDQMYNEGVWNGSVKALVISNTSPLDSIVLIGHDKDETTYYLKAFPEWGRLELANYCQLNATPIREQYFSGKEVIEIEGLTQASQRYLSEFRNTQHYSELQQEFNYIKSYKASWSKAPYPPMHVTTDAVVICNQHILLVQRGHFPGKGLWALPGGFLEQKEWIWEGLIRELIEETSIDLSVVQLKTYLVKTKVFDNPGRSQIGRVITNAGLFEITGHPLPRIKAADDAAAAKWLPLSEFWQISDQLHDDHYFIVKYLLE